MGIPDEVIKKMEQSDIDNVVYGVMSPVVAEKYGIVVQEPENQF